MELNVNKLGETIEGSVKTHKMRMSDNAEAMQFKIFTSNVYSNPIGTVVREITSNCFDSHNEAGIKAPVLIKLSKDNIGQTYYISFIDFGVGMSPTRVSDVYSRYFESTKRNSNNEIGGFGIGGKTPLAYKRYDGEGDNEYDNSFFVNTIHNGIKYQYVIMEGEKSPEYALLHSEKTTKGNGTEVRIPVLENDIRKFAKEIKQQLFYFENLTFEGFDLLNIEINSDYDIYMGEHFKYRPDFKIDSYVHVCLGGVYYPINYNVLDLDPWSYQMPIALDIPIGDITVTVSRESLDYSKATINYLKNKLKLVGEEITKMKLKQNEGVVTYVDYVKNSKYSSKLSIGENIVNLPNFINIGVEHYPNFKFKNLKKIPDQFDVIKYLFVDRIYGEKSGYNQFAFRNSLDYIIKYSDKIYISSLPKDEQKLIRIKQSYLKDKHKSYAILYPQKDIDNEFLLNQLLNSIGIFSHGSTNQKLTDDVKGDVINILKEVKDYICDNVQHYDSVVVPDEFKLTYNVRIKKVNNENSEFNAYLVNSYSRNVVSTKKLSKFHGKIVYSVKDDPKLNAAIELYRDYFDSTKLINNINSYSKNFNQHYGIAFIGIAKTNINKIKNLPNAITVDEFFKNIGLRKLDEFVKTYQKVTYLKSIEAEIQRTMKHETFFYNNSLLLSKKGLNFDTSIFNYGSTNRIKRLYDRLLYVYPNIEFDKIDEGKDVIEFKKQITKLIKFTEKNEILLKLINSDRIMSYIDESEVNDLFKMFKM